MPSGSSPASCNNNATTPCAGTMWALKLRTAVPLSVCVQRSCSRISRDKQGVSMNKGMATYTNRVLSPRSDPRGFGEIEGQVSGVIQTIDLILIYHSEPYASQSPQLSIIIRTNMNTVPFCVSPLQKTAGWA